MFWNQPLFLLPLATLPLLSDYVAPRYLLMLSGEHLWPVTTSEAPHAERGRRSACEVTAGRTAAHPQEFSDKAENAATQEVP